MACFGDNNDNEQDLNIGHNPEFMRQNATNVALFTMKISQMELGVSGSKLLLEVIYWIN